MAEQPTDGKREALLCGEHRQWTIFVWRSGVSFLATGSTAFARCRAGPLRDVHLAMSIVDAAKCYELAKHVIDQDYSNEAERVEQQAKRDCNQPGPFNPGPWIPDDQFLAGAGGGGGGA